MAARWPPEPKVTGSNPAIETLRFVELIPLPSLRKLGQSRGKILEHIAPQLDASRQEISHRESERSAYRYFTSTENIVLWDNSRPTGEVTPETEPPTLERQNST